VPLLPGNKRALRLPSRSSDRIAHDVDDELAFHLELKTRELIDAGHTPEAAQHLARAQFGDLEYTRRYLRGVDGGTESHARRVTLLEEIWQDTKYALRQLRHSPAYTAIAVLTLALGIGANTAIFSVVHGVLLRSLPYTDPPRLMRLYSLSNGRRMAISPPDFLDWREGSRSFAGMAAWFESNTNLTGVGDPVRLTQVRVSANFFDVLGVRAQLGRTFVTGEDRREAPRVTLLSDRLWRTRFGSDPGIVGKKITLDGHPTEIVGVARREMQYPEDIDLWLTTRFDTGDVAASSRGARWIRVIGRLAPGMTVDAAQRDVAAIARRLEQQDPRHNTGYGATVVPLMDSLVAPIRRPLLVLLGAVGFVLLIACANVAGLALGRTAARETELAVRTALGAGRGRLVRQLLTESLCLTLMGAAAGLLLARYGVRALVALAPSDIPRLGDVRLDGTVLAFTLIVAVVTGTLFGLVPALYGSTRDLSLRLKDGTRGSQGRAGSGRARSVLVVSELAMAIMLLIGASLLLRSFATIRDVDPGFRTARVSTFTMDLSPVKYPDFERQRVFAEQLLARMQRILGVATAGLTFGLPLTGSNFNLSFTVSGRPAQSPADEPAAQTRIATPDYFATMGIPLVRGRVFTERDRKGAPQVALISREVARRFFAGEDPIGQHLQASWRHDGVPFGGEIIGIVGDVKQFALGRDAPAHIYVPVDQWPMDELTVVMRSTGDAASTLRAAEAAVRELDPDLPVYDAQTLDKVVSESLGQPRFYTVLLGAFAGVALLLAAVGVYGVISYGVQRRTREIGIRLALGASSGRIVQMVVGQGLMMAVGGIAIGIAGAFALTRVLRSLLFGISATDPVTFVLVPVILAAVALIASYLPARRAARVDPIQAVRS
jgi:putative ABC transport system permease protein